MDPRLVCYHLGALALVAGVAWLAVRREDASLLPRGWFLMELATAVAFGGVLEWVGVHVLGYYFYDPTPFTVLGVPASITAGWGAIIYACMRTSDRLALPAWSRPFLDAFLAVVIDLGMDAVACRLKIWTWTFFPEAGRWDRDWFGVPFGNYYAWIFVVLLYSVLMRACRARAGGDRRLLWLAPVPVALASEAGVYLLIQFGFWLKGLGVPDNVVMAWPWLLVGVPALYAAARGRQLSALDWPCYAVPAFFHLYSFVLLAFTPLPHGTPAFWWASCAVLAFALGLHAWLASPVRRPRELVAVVPAAREPVPR